MYSWTCSLSSSPESLQDAWLDSIDVAPKYAGKASAVVKNDDDVQEISSKDIAMMKRRIADVLKPGETVIVDLWHLFFIF